MSRFSGKCDVYSTLVDIHEYTDEELKNNIKIYLGDMDIPLPIESRKDLIPCYPHIVSSAGFNNTERSANIRITKDSFVDSEENVVLKNGNYSPVSVQIIKRETYVEIDNITYDS